MTPKRPRDPTQLRWSIFDIAAGWRASPRSSTPASTLASSLPDRAGDLRGRPGDRPTPPSDHTPLGRRCAGLAGGVLPGGTRVRIVRVRQHARSRRLLWVCEAAEQLV